MKKILIITIIVFSISCSTSLQDHNYNQIESAKKMWKGETEHTLVMSWGPPNSKTSDGAGGKIYTYKRNNGYIIWVTNFYINQDDIIYHLAAHSE